MNTLVFYHRRQNGSRREQIQLNYKWLDCTINRKKEVISKMKGFVIRGSRKAGAKIGLLKRKKVPQKITT